MGKCVCGRKMGRGGGGGHAAFCVRGGGESDGFMLMKVEGRVWFSVFLYWII